MLKTIDKQQFADAIRQSYKTMTEVSSLNLAIKLMESLDESLEEAVKAWIEGKEIPDIATDKYSVNKILTIRNNSDYLEAFRLLSEYINDPQTGEKLIWKPVRDMR
jgi:hypothetical protein